MRTWPILNGRAEYVYVVSENVYNQFAVGIDGKKLTVAEATETWVEGLVANFARQPEGGDVDQIKAVAA